MNEEELRNGLDKWDEFVARVERDRRDGKIWAVVWAITTILIIGFFIWVAVIADCKHLGWLPLKDLPARCLAR